MKKYWKYFVSRLSYFSFSLFAVTSRPIDAQTSYHSIITAILKYSNSLIFTARRYASAVYAVDCDGSAVHLSVRSSQTGIGSKWLNVGSCKQRRTITQGSSFLAKDLWEIRLILKSSNGRMIDHPLGDVLRCWGYRDIFNLGEVTDNLRNGTKYRHSIRQKTNRKSCDLSNDTNSNDLDWPWRPRLLFETL